MTTTTRPTADDLNARLTSGGFVQVTTMTRSWVYGAKHAGWFSERDGSLYVRAGRSANRLSHGPQLLVSVRTGHYA